MSLPSQVLSLSLIFLLTLGEVNATELNYKAPDLAVEFFGKDLKMLQRERDDYANALVSIAVNRVNEEAGESQIDFARRSIALALNLSPRNRLAIIANHHLSRDTIPPRQDPKYSPATLASLFLTRAKLLFQDKEGKEALLARALTELAVELDPENEEAIYAYELQKIDFGPFPWRLLTDVPQAER